MFASRMPRVTPRITAIYGRRRVQTLNEMVSTAPAKTSEHTQFYGPGPPVSPPCGRRELARGLLLNFVVDCYAQFHAKEHTMRVEGGLFWAGIVVYALAGCAYAIPDADDASGRAGMRPAGSMPELGGMAM